MLEPTTNEILADLEETELPQAVIYPCMFDADMPCLNTIGGKCETCEKKGLTP